MMTASIVVALYAMGCNKTVGAGGGDSDASDTDFTVDDGWTTVTSPSCLTLSRAGVNARDWDLTDTGTEPIDYCYLEEAEGNRHMVTPTGRPAEITLSGTGTQPDSGTVRVTATFVYTDPDGNGHQTYYPKDGSEPLDFSTLDLATVTGTSGWTADAFETDLGDFGTKDCWFDGECNWQFYVEVRDTETDGDACDQFADVQVCFDWSEDRSRRRKAMKSTCHAGAGTFMLVPMKTLNADDDAYSTLLLKPVQTSGTGVLTGDAWITSIDVTEAPAEPLSVITDGDLVWHTDDDSVVMASSLDLDTEDNNAFGLEELTGGTSFVVLDADNEEELGWTVDMEWSCGYASPTQRVARAPGYVFKLDDLDCLVSPPQQFVFRPHVDMVGGGYLELELYGDPQSVKRIPLKLDNGEYDFHLAEAGLDVSGRLIDWDIDSAHVAIDGAYLDNVEICDAGTYEIQSEKISPLESVDWRDPSQLYLAGEDVETLSSAVTLWKEHYGRSEFDLVTVNGGPPTLDPSYDDLNDNPAVVFGGDASLDSDGYSFAFGDFTMVIVFKDESPIVYEEALLDFGYWSSVWVGRNDSNADSWTAGIQDRTWPWGQQVSAEDDDPHVLVIRREGDERTMIVDGDGDVTSCSDDAADPTWLRMGGARWGSELTGAIAAVAIYDSALSDPELDGLQTQLAAAYGTPP